jgi:flagellar basal body-associated protein FliL
VKLPIPRGRRAILILGLPLGLAAAGALAFTMLSPKAAPPAVPDPSPGQLGPMLALDSSVINLSDTTASGFKYAKVGVTVELRPSTSSFYSLHGTDRTKSETTELASYNQLVPVLDDTVGTVVSGEDSSKLDSIDGRAKLKADLLTAIRKVLGDKVVIDVFLTAFVMQ